jgi:hypothetical protein
MVTADGITIRADKRVVIGSDPTNLVAITARFSKVKMATTLLQINAITTRLLQRSWERLQSASDEEIATAKLTNPEPTVAKNT